MLEPCQAEPLCKIRVVILALHDPHVEGIAKKPRDELKHQESGKISKSLDTFSHRASCGYISTPLRKPEHLGVAASQ